MTTLYLPRWLPDLLRESWNQRVRGRCRGGVRCSGSSASRGAGTTRQPLARTHWPPGMKGSAVGADCRCPSARGLVEIIGSSDMHHARGPPPLNSLNGDHILIVGDSIVPVLQHHENVVHLHPQAPRRHPQRTMEAPPHPRRNGHDPRGNARALHHATRITPHTTFTQRWRLSSCCGVAANSPPTVFCAHTMRATSTQLAASRSCSAVSIGRIFRGVRPVMAIGAWRHSSTRAAPFFDELGTAMWGLHIVALAVVTVCSSAHDQDQVRCQQLYGTICTSHISWTWFSFGTRC